MTLEQIDAEARKIAGAAWDAMDERDRLPYRREALKLMSVVPSNTALLVHQEEEDIAGRVP